MKYIDDELMNSITEWNKETFVDATMLGQLEKLEEELQELKECKSTEHAKEEMADVFIVLAGLRRFNSQIGVALEEYFKKKFNYRDVFLKMDKNRKRVWKKTSENGSYHH